VSWLIEAEMLSKIYRFGARKIVALDDVSLSIAEGEYVALVGPSGSGKTTLLKIMGCLETATTGRFLFNGSQITNVTLDDMAEIRNSLIGFLFQSFVLLPQSTALENVELPLAYAGVPRAERRRRAAAALARMGLVGREDHLPGRLSGGEQQRVALARAVVNNPKLLLADEPTGALDDDSAAQVMRLFAELNRSGMTIVVVTHEMRLAGEAARVLRLKDGRLSAEARCAAQTSGSHERRNAIELPGTWPLQETNITGPQPNSRPVQVLPLDLRSTNPQRSQSRTTANENRHRHGIVPDQPQDRGIS
jgi:putative ABC transport system ATP-binding protein